MMKLTRLMAAWWVMVALTPMAFGFNAANKLCWDPNAEADLAGYRLHLLWLEEVRTE